MAVCPNLALIPGGSFAMGDAFADFGSDEVPFHIATVSAFYMDRTKVPKVLWDIVYSSATNNGYGFAANVGRGKAPTHPVQVVSWYDAVKWCNARSQLEGLTPCYHTNQGLMGVYSIGQVALSNSFVNWAANGYRLPTEAEWEEGRARWGERHAISMVGHECDFAHTRKLPVRAVTSPRTDSGFTTPTDRNRSAPVVASDEGDRIVPMRPTTVAPCARA